MTKRVTPHAKRSPDQRLYPWTLPQTADIGSCSVLAIYANCGPRSARGAKHIHGEDDEK